MLAVRDANRMLKLERADYALAGFLMDQAGRLLNAGESIEYNGSRFTVERIERRRIRRIRLEPLANKEIATTARALSVLGAALSLAVTQAESKLRQCVNQGSSHSHPVSTG